MKRVLLICLCLTGIFSCSDTESGVSFERKGTATIQDELPVESYIEYIKTPVNSLSLIKKMDDFTFTAKYIPQEYMALRELGVDSLNPESFAKRVSELSELQYFTFSIQNKNYRNELLKYNLGNESEYYSRIEYFSFKMQEDIKLIDGNDTLMCELFHFERTYDIATYITFTMAFKNTKNFNDRIFTFNDLVFKNGQINITFDKSTFMSIPKIKLS
jgi:hypothetical protein